MPAQATAVAVIDLAAVAANFRDLRAIHGAPIAGVVKADAYGLSAEHVAPVLARAGAAMLFTAGFDEAAALDVRATGHPHPGPLPEGEGEARKGEARKGEGAAPSRPHFLHPLPQGEGRGEGEVHPNPIPRAVLDGLSPGTEAAFLEAGLVPVLNDLGQVQRWAATARREGRRLPALLHLDTGMRRLGLDDAEAARLIADPSDLGALDVRYVMTHLACADEPGHPLNAAQAGHFAQLRAALPPMRTSLANSSGIFLGEKFRSDLGRPGAATYGINPTPGRPNPMRPVVQLYARILQVRSIAAGDSVGYGASFVAKRRSRIATAAIGYADGFPRALSARALATLDGTAFPLVGRVSMDLTTFDITDLPDGLVHPGGFVALLDGANDADAVGARANTIGYEILTSLSRRAHRIWTGA